MLNQLIKSSDRTAKSPLVKTVWKPVRSEYLEKWSTALSATSCSYRQFPYWAQAYEVENHKARFFYCGSGDDPIAFAAIVEVNLFSFRFGLIDRGPFFFTSEDTLINECLLSLTNLFKKRGYVFVRFTQGQEFIFEKLLELSDIERIEPYPFCRDSRNSMLVEQKTDEAETIGGFSETARQEIRKAMRFDYDIRPAINDTDFEKAWQMFENLASKKGFLLSPRPRNFWHEVLRLGSQANRARLYLCFHRDELVASQIHVRDGTVCEAMLAAADRDLLDKKPSPSALMYFKGMRFGHEFGCSFYNMGGPGDPKRNNHLFEFKRKFRPHLHVAPEPVCLVLKPRHYRLWTNVILRGWRAWRRRFGKTSHAYPQIKKVSANGGAQP